MFPRVQSVQAARELKRKMDDLGISAYNTDTFITTPGMDVAAYRETLEIGAALGAKVINSLNLVPDLDEAVKLYRPFCKMAADHGLDMIIEWYRFSETKTLNAALDLVKRIGEPNVRLNVDVLHLIRNGNQPADLAAVPAAMKHYAQICDGPLYQPDEKQPAEGSAERNFPGEEEFPLVDFVKNLPKDGVLCIEAPVNRMQGTLTPMQRAKRAVDGTRKILAAAGR